MEEILTIFVVGIGLIFLFWLGSMIMGLLMSAVFDKADKEASKGNGNWLVAILIIIVIITLAAWIFGGGSLSGDSNRENELQYRHTDRIY